MERQVEHIRPVCLRLTSSQSDTSKFTKESTSVLNTVLLRLLQHTQIWLNGSAPEPVKTMEVFITTTLAILIRIHSIHADFSVFFSLWGFPPALNESQFAQNSSSTGSFYYIYVNICWWGEVSKPSRAGGQTLPLLMCPQWASRACSRNVSPPSELSHEELKEQRPGFSSPFGSDQVGWTAIWTFWG